MSRKRARQKYAAITGSSTDIEPDVYGHKRRAVRRVVQKLNNARDDTFDCDDDPFVISDTSAAAQYLISQSIK
ncbi:hypothetical protein DFQ28_004302 [Apophysomyces sp. BC1034]|nr:hypothetical protein DFQ29_003005 [Apophysomyces sp. BC1021]KAG0188836.1 hypothetical protein DFQ28_004302 [Apophysomyces sp. BC1034]